MDAPAPLPLELRQPVSPDARPWVRFLGAWLAATSLLLLLVAALNVAVDPFFVFGTPLVPGFNRYKPATQGREDIAKLALLPRAGARTVLIGTSKVQVGLNPLSTAWDAADQPVFNAGLPGSTSPATLATVEDALAGPVHRVLVVLEPADLMEPAVPFVAAPSPRPVGWARLTNLVDTTLTRDAFEASVQTLLGQWTDLPSGLRPNGQMYDGIFRGPTLSEGPGALFGQKMPVNAERVARTARLLAGRTDGPIAQLETVRRIVGLCREKGVALDFALAPVHGDMLRLIALAGLWPRYLLMREELARTVADVTGGQVRLWNFTGFNDYSTEPVPAFGQRAAPLRWFWEPNHFRPEYGQLVLETIYRGREGVGTLLTPADVAQSDQAQTAAMGQDRVAQPAEWARAAAALAKATAAPDRR